MRSSMAQALAPQHREFERLRGFPGGLRGRAESADSAVSEAGPSRRAHRAALPSAL